LLFVIIEQKARKKATADRSAVQGRRMYEAIVGPVRKGSPIGLIHARLTRTAVPLVFGSGQSGATVPQGRRHV
jgi:hypothetical protein